MKLMVIDGNSLINRAFYGIRMLTTRDGTPTNAVYGFLNILEKERSEEKPDALCVAFDLHAPTFRHLAYDGYKATRHPMPEELAMQMPLMKEVLGAMNIPIYECEGWEADDILGTAGEICAREGEDCVIVTGDRDSLQLVTDRVTVKLVTSKSGQTITTNYTPDVFRAEYGFDPMRLVDLKSLMGDSSDNIPGVAGIGPKTATGLLLEYGTLDGVYEHLPEIKESVRKKLEKDHEQAYLSYDLATIRKNAPVDFIPERNLVREVDNDALYALFHRLEFTRLIARYGLHAPQEAPKPQEKIEAVCTCEAVTDAAQAREIATRLSKERYVNLAVSEDLSKIAVQLEDAGFLFSGEAVLDNDFMSTMFGASVTHPDYTGQMVCDLASRLDLDPCELVMDVLYDDRLTTNGIYHCMQDEDVNRVLQFSHSMIGSDGLYYKGCSGAHPRAFGTFTRVLGHYVREKNVLSLEEAVRKMTSLPASVYQLKGKGLIRPGMDADLVLFDPHTVSDQADFTDFSKRGTGIELVWIRGEKIVEHGIYNGVKAGKLIRHVPHIS